MIKTGDGYSIFDPAILENGRYVLAAPAGVNHKHQTRNGLVILAFIIIAVVSSCLLFGDGSFWSGVLWTFIGLCASGVVLVLSAGIFSWDRIAKYKKNHGSDPSIDVSHGSGRQERFCQLGLSIADTSSWRDSAVDPDRLLGDTVWSAVRRDRHMSVLQDELRNDELSGVSESALTEARALISKLDTELSEVESNLREVQNAARNIDRKSVPARSVASKRSASHSATTALPATDLDNSIALVAQSRAMDDLI